MSSQKLIDYFVISGLNISTGLEPDQLSGDNLHCSPLDRPYKAYILAHYPEQTNGNAFDADAVCVLCHPRGLWFRTQRDGGRREPRFHSFIITREDGSRTYGSSLVFDERVTDEKICLAMQTLQAMHDAELSNTQSLTLGRNPRRRTTADMTSSGGSRYATAPRHSSLESRHSSMTHQQSSPSTTHGSTSKSAVMNTPPGKSPRRSPRRRDNTSLSATDVTQPATRVYCRATDTLYCTRCICIISRIPLVVTFERILRSLYGGATGEKLSSFIGALTNLLYDIPLPLPGTSLRISLLSGTHICQRPGLTELPLLDYPLRQLFDLLGIETVLDVITGVLLERQILFYSQSFDRLMLVSECITALIFPFRWQHVYVPILPASMLHFLDAPIPFIMGLQADDTKTLLDTCSQANVWMVDVDSGDIDKPEDLPVFPFIDLLKQDLEQEWRRHGNLSNATNAASQRDSGCVRDSIVSVGDSDNTSGSSWSINARMEMLRQNEVMAQMQALARKSGVTCDDISESLTDVAISRHRTGAATPFTRSTDEHVRDLMLNSAIREIFLHYFLQIFGCYESFVIQSGATDLESWTMNRETMLNFDKTAFLGDQREDHLQFMSSFIETQMFASFIDSKILSQWSEPDRNLHVFETRLKAQRDDSCEQRFRRFYRTAAAKEAESLIEKRATVIDIATPPPKAVEDTAAGVPYQQGCFPILPANMFSKVLSSTQARSHERWRQKYGLTQKASEQKQSFEQRDKYIEEVNMKTSRQPTVTTDMNPKAMVNNNLKFNDALLKECKARTKRMLVQKMGQEAVDLGHGDMTVVGVEENTLIASLCDLLERIWSHGLQHKQGKSPLWSHLVNFHLADQQNKLAEQSAQTNDPSQPVTESYVVESNQSGSSGTQTWPMRGHRRKPSRGPELPVLDPLPVSVLFDMRNVWKMSEIKTEFGYSRAFVRLALEKKLLSRHLKELLSNQELLRSRYRRYAFLRCEDEREQFLYHLLSLNAVDYFCFTKTFTTTLIQYRVLVFPRLKLSGGSTTANCWLSIAGQLGETEQIQLPKHTLDITIQNKNLGTLTTMRIGHDNSGLSPKWMVEHVLVRNEITGLLYRFPCGRWLGRGVDDGAIERLLVAEPVPPTVDAAGLSCGEIQERLCDAINSLVKHFYKPEKERGSLTSLLCGEYGLVYCMEQVFQYGFKSSRLFRNRFYTWDFLEKVLSYLETLLGDTENYEIAPEVSTTMQSLCYVITCINQASESIGKDGRFQLFICIGIRDRLLPRWLKIISKTRVTANMYEEQSFLRDPTLVQFVYQILDSLKEFEITLESSLIKGVSL